MILRTLSVFCTTAELVDRTASFIAHIKVFVHLSSGVLIEVYMTITKSVWCNFVNDSGDFLFKFK